MTRTDRGQPATGPAADPLRPDATTAAPGRARRVAVLAARTALVAAPLAYLFVKTDLRLVARSLLGLSAPALLGCVLLQLAYLALVSLRWRRLIVLFAPPGAPPPRVGYLLRTHLVAEYASFLPVTGANEATRVWRTRHLYGGATVTAAGVVVVERLVGLTSLMLLGAVAWLSATGSTHGAVAPTLALGVTVVAVAAMGLVGLPVIAQRVGPVRAALARHPRVERWVGQLPRVTRPAGLAAPLALSMMAHLVASALPFVAFAALGEGHPLLTVLRVQPLLQLIMAFPITPAGVGQRELAFVTLYGVVGVSRSIALGASLIGFSLTILQAMLGFFVLVVERRRGGDPR